MTAPASTQVEISVSPASLVSHRHVIVTCMRQALPRTSIGRLKLQSGDDPFLQQNRSDIDVSPSGISVSVDAPHHAVNAVSRACTHTAIRGQAGAAPLVHTPLPRHIVRMQAYDAL